MKAISANIRLFLFSLIAFAALSACDMYHKTYVSPNKMQIVETSYSEQVPLGLVNDSYLEVVAGKYDQQGRGPFDLTVAYDPASKENNAARAGAEASKIAGKLARNGIKDMNVSIMPAHEHGETMSVLMSYDSYEARPPEDCGLMAGMEGTQIEADPNYKLGCSVNTILAKQIARPRDLAGIVDESPTSDGRRASKIIEIYRAGSKDQKLEGESASGD